MPEITVETLLNQIETLPAPEKMRLISTLLERLNGEKRPTPDFEYLKPIQEPDPGPNYRWMEQHAREYGGQWVALDGDRLIVNGTDAAAVFAAAEADGAYLPLVTYIPPADSPPFIGL
ncbi:MAG TPA: DUF5678 domain-containing protein [Blastocatellia bacterium]|nr:DUF5678 domain-containing protein [Blastocatellia bacterium]